MTAFAVGDRDMVLAFIIYGRAVLLYSRLRHRLRRSVLSYETPARELIPVMTF